MPRRPATIAFLFLVLGVPLGQAAWELARGLPVQALAVFTARPSARRFRAFEEDLRRASFLRTALVPRYEALLAALFGRGNEKVLRAADGWLFYGPDLDYLTRREHFARAAADAVIDLGRQLGSRGVALLVVPVEPKPVLAWRRLGLPERPASTAGALFRARLAAAAVPLVELPSDLEFLPRDTHWTPGAMRTAAGRTAARALELLGAPPAPAVAWTEEPRLVRGAGDLVGMLSAPSRFPRMELVVDQVLDRETGGFFHADRAAEVLLLGDSFSRVFGDAALGLGSGAGFDAHLARELGAGLDVIALSGGGARAVREALARRREGLAGKRLVIWQLSLRDLVADAERWQRVDLSAAPAGEEHAREGEWTVVAELAERSVAPEGFDYATLLAVHEYRRLDPRGAGPGEPDGEPIWVAHLVLRDHRPTAAASYALGARQRLTLVPIEERYDLERTSWLDDTEAGPRIWFAASVEPVE